MAWLTFRTSLRVFQVLVATGLLSSTAMAGQLRIRAREHYEEMEVRGAGTDTFSGFTNTINIWYEEPFRFSIGFAGSPLLASLRTKGDDSGLGGEIRLVHLGLEGKVFPARDLVNCFVRFGAYQATLRSRDEDQTLRGTSQLGSLGYEYDWDGVGIAPEMAWRRGVLTDGVGFRGTAPAIGVHFYKLL